MANEEVAAGVGKILKAARSITTRYATKRYTNVLAADRKAIAAGLLAIGDTDVPLLILSKDSRVTPLPGTPAPPPVDPPESTPMKWNPSHFMLSDTFAIPATDTPEVLGYSIAQLDDYASLGVNFHAYAFWRRLEETRGDYSAGFAWFDTLVALCAARGMRVSLQLVYTSFGGTSARHLPPYLATEPGGNGGWWTKSPAGSGVQAKIGLTAISDRVIALIEAYGARYNGNPWVEMFQCHETSMAPGPDETKAGMGAQYVRWNTAMRAAWPNTLTSAHVNFTNSQSYESTFMADCYAKGMAIGGPDVYPQTAGIHGAPIKARTWADETYIGNVWNGSAWVSGGVDYRGKLPRMSHFADPIHGRDNVGCYTTAQLYDWALSEFGNSHMFHSPKTYAFSGSQPQVYYNSGTNPRIRDWLADNLASKPTNTTFPTRFTELGYAPQTGGT